MKGTNNSTDARVSSSEKPNGIKAILQLKTSAVRLIAALAGMIAIGSILLVLVCCLPEDRIDGNIKTSSDMMSAQGDYPRLMINSEYFQMDNWSDASLLNMIYTGSSRHPVELAFAQKQYYISGKDVTSTGKLHDAIYDANNSNGIYMLRSTYWHGMRIFLIPLLLFKDYYWIRIAIVMFSFILLTICVLKIGKDLGLWQGTVFAISFVMLNWFVTTGLWSDGAPCLWVCCTVILVILGLRGRTDLDICCLFVLAGGLTSYFDWFSCPLITFGLPVVILIALKSRENGCTITESLNILFRSAVGWCIGYGGMLAGRVAISTLVAGRGGLENFMERAVYNVTSTGGTVSRLKEIWLTIIKGVRGIFPMLFLSDVQISVMLIACIVIMALLTVIFIKKVPQVAAYFLVSSAPFVWFIVFNGYCRVHYWIAYRVFSVTVFAWAMILIDVLGYVLSNYRKGQGFAFARKVLVSRK